MSSLSDQISDDLKDAMRAKDSVATTVLRNLKSAFKYVAIEQGTSQETLDESTMISVVRKQIKQRQDSVESFRQGNRDDLAEKELVEIRILEKYLPPEPDADEISTLVETTINELGATSRKDMGAVMKRLQEVTAGGVDNKLLSQEVMKQLS